MIKKLSLIFVLILFLVSCDLEPVSPGSNTNNDVDAISIIGDSMSDSDFQALETVLDKKNLSSVMIKELMAGIKKNQYKVSKVNDTISTQLDIAQKAEFKIDVIKTSTTVVIDGNGKLEQKRWFVGSDGDRGSGESRAEVPRGTEKGHIKSINEGAQDNCIEDSPLNIIPQNPVVNDPNIKRFEFYRVNECQGCEVINDILDDGYVRVRIPEKDIDVKYNPLSDNEWEEEWYKTNAVWD